MFPEFPQQDVVYPLHGLALAREVLPVHLGVQGMSDTMLESCGGRPHLEQAGLQGAKELGKAVLPQPEPFKGLEHLLDLHLIALKKVMMPERIPCHGVKRLRVS